MNKFIQSIEKQCSIFEHLLSYEITISSNSFTKNKGYVKDFVDEIKLTARFTIQKKSQEHIEYYVQKLISQFIELKEATDKLLLLSQTNMVLPKFISNYQFNKKFSNLSSTQKLQEYHKALRALNEKLSWLIEQIYLCSDNKQKKIYQEKIYETEYRKQKCINAINALE
ncbi:primosomal replication protein PriC [Otariodibacter sp.]|uniref:primosomal replication protein PriC n=1 Tax=Otariodibacter sp. TaxID=3030919 RepID=UPI0026158976|nr:primosomal replication protein PriC [Otariodibacter sp.]